MPCETIRGRRDPIQLRFGKRVIGKGTRATTKPRSKRPAGSKGSRGSEGPGQ